MDRKKVGSFCKDFRKNTLHLTLYDMCKNTDVSIQSLSAFENGKSTNYKYLYMYFKACNYDTCLENYFTRGIFTNGN